VYIDRICSIFAEAMPYKDLPYIWSPSATLQQQLSGEPRGAQISIAFNAFDLNKLAEKQI